MKLSLTSRDFMLLLGIAVATVIVVASLFYRDAIITASPQLSKKPKATASAAMLVQKRIKAVSEIIEPK